MAGSVGRALIQPKRILPGHGPVIDNWPDVLARQRRYLEILTRDVRSLISRGAPISEAARSAGQSGKDQWNLFENYNARNATAAYAELGMGVMHAVTPGILSVAILANDAP
jgi:hypothetical protein